MNHKKKIFVLSLFLIASLCLNVGADSTKVLCSTDDVYMRENGSTYSVVQSDDCASYWNPSISVARFGQTLWGGQFWLPRSFHAYNTAPIPDAHVLDSAFLQVYIINDWSATDFEMTIVQGLWTSDPADSCDYETGVGIGEISGGSLNTSGISANAWARIELNSTGLSWISKTGVTRLCLRSDRDISATAPTGDEQVQHNAGMAGGFEPSLVTYHHSAEPPEGRNSLLVKKRQRG